MKDAATNTEHDAGRFEQAQAYQVDDRDHDEPTVPVERTHQCDDPDCRDLLCVLDRTVKAQRAARENDPVWREHVAQQNQEWHQ